MKKSKPQRRRPAPPARRAAALSFAAFALVALAIVALLEFLDYQAGKRSFIFNDVLRLERKQPSGERFGRDLAAWLMADGIAYDFVRDRDGVAHLKVDLPGPRVKAFAGDLGRLVARHGGQQRLSEVQGGGAGQLHLYQVRFGRRLTHVLLVGRRPAPRAAAAGKAAAAEPPPAKAQAAVRPRAAWSGRPRLAIVIDDIGYADLVSDRLHELGIPVTGAVIPAAPYARSEAQRLHAFGLEEIVHLPMQPKDPANHHPRDQFVLVDSSDAEIEALLDEALRAVPFAKGLNNHMGSRLTSDPPAARRLLEQVRARGLFFVDSKTASTTVAHALAREMGVRTVLRDVFLDDVQTAEHTSGQLRRLVETAREKGRALAIGHPFPSTLAALRDAAPWLRSQPVEIVFVSQILE